MGVLTLWPTAFKGTVTSVTPSNTTESDYYKLINEVLPDNDATTINLSPSNVAYIKFSIPNNIDISKIELSSFRIWFNSQSTVGYTNLYYDLTYYSDTLNSTIIDTGFITPKSNQYSDLMESLDITNNNNIIKNALIDNDLCLKLYSTSTKDVIFNISQMRIEIAYEGEIDEKETFTFYIKQDNIWNNLYGTIYCKENDVWTLYDGTVPINETSFAIIDLT